MATGHKVYFHKTAEPGHATAAAAAQIGQDATAVVVVGGDGTVREVAQGLLNRPIPMAILPTGTENLIARQLGVTRSTAQLLNTLQNGNMRRVDVGYVNDQVFLVVAGIGFDAEVVQRLSRRRRSYITHLDYAAPLWRTFWGHRFPTLTVSIGQELVFTGSGLVLVGNMPRYGSGLRILRRARDDDGKLDVCIYPCASRFKLVGHALRTAVGRHLTRGDALYFRTADLHVSSPAVVPVQLDGDVGPPLPIRIRIQPGALTMLVPPTERVDATPRLKRSLLSAKVT